MVGLHHESLDFLNLVGGCMGWSDNLIVERVDDVWRIGWATTGCFYVCKVVEGRI